MKTLFIRLSTLSVFAFSASVFAMCEEDKTAHAPTVSDSIQAAVVANAATGNRQSVKVSKMHCMSCASKIRKALKTEMGLKDVKIDVETKVVSFTCPSTACPMDEISTLLTSIGYPIESVL